MSLLVSTSALAETPAPTPTAASAPSPNSGSDIVRLKNGGVVRGKISELLPGASVTIVSASGKTHEFQMNEVSYAGPESQDPAATAAPPAPPPASKPPQIEWSNQGSDDTKPYVTVHGAEAKLKLVSDPPGLTFHRENSSAIAYGRGGVAQATGYERLCTSPCSISLPAGTESFALSADGKAPVSAGSVTFPAGESTIQGTYNKRSGVRVAGVVVIVASAVAGAALLATSFNNTCDYGDDTCSKLNPTNLLAGTLILGLGVGIGAGLLLIPDGGNVQVVPSSNAPHPEPVARVRMPALALRGAF